MPPTATEIIFVGIAILAVLMAIFALIARCVCCMRSRNKNEMLISPGERAGSGEKSKLGDSDLGSSAGSYAKFENVDENPTSLPHVNDEKHVSFEDEISGGKSV